MKKLKIRFLGGTKEVGRSCVHLDTDRSNILLDCGLKQDEISEYPDLAGVGAVDSVILSHAHIDHTGGLPLLSNKGLFREDASIFCTPPTATIAKTLLWDSYKLQKACWDEEGKDYPFDEKDVKEILERIKTVPYQSFSVTEDVEAEFGNAGHILGSAWVLVKAGGKTILYSGDIGEGRSNHLPRAEEAPNSNVLITESTYGGTRQHESFSDVCNELINLASRNIPVLIPSFAVGRSQEILRLLKTREEIDDSRIFYDGMITDLMPTYRGYTSDAYMSEPIVNSIRNSGDPRPFHPEGAEIPRTMRDRRKIARKVRNPIIVAPSGMLQGGWSTFYLKEFSRYRQNAKVLLVGYQAESTAGRKLSECSGENISLKLNALTPPEEAEEEVDSFGFHDTEVTIPCNWIHSLSGFSTHAGSNFLLRFARSVLPEKICLVHGDEENISALREVFKGDSSLKNAEVKIPELGEKLDVEKEIPKSFESRLEKLEEKVKKLERKQKKKEQN